MEKRPSEVNRREGIPRRNERKRPVVLTSEELEQHLESIQRIWQMLGVEPLSFIANSDSIREMNGKGEGDRIREIAKLQELVPMQEPTFCILPQFIEPQIAALSDIWTTQHKADDDKVRRASEDVRQRNRNGLGSQLEKLFDTIPSFIRRATLTANTPSLQPTSATSA